MRGYTLRTTPAYAEEFTRHAPTWQSVRPWDNPGHFFRFAFPPPPVHQTSKITRAKAAAPGGEHFPIYQQHIHEHSHIKALREICSPLYSFHNNVRNKCREMRNKALCYVSLRRKLHRRISGLKLNGAGGLLVRCTLHSEVLI